MLNEDKVILPMIVVVVFTVLTIITITAYSFISANSITLMVDDKPLDCVTRKYGISCDWEKYNETN